MSGPWPFKERRQRCHETARSGVAPRGRRTCHMQAPGVKDTAACTWQSGRTPPRSVPVVWRGRWRRLKTGLDGGNKQPVAERIISLRHIQISEEC